MSMDAPTWDIIGPSLKLVLSKYDLDLSNIGLAQRIDYKDFEQIFYHLFMIIEPAETKRKFWSIYPSKNPEARARFVETSLQMINVKQMSPYRASLAQLKMLGGDPFRRLLGSLIEKAAECEVQNILKKYPKCDIDIETNFESNTRKLEMLQRDIGDRLPDMKKTLSRFGPMQETLNNINSETHETLEMLNVKAFRELNNLDSDIKHIKGIFNSLRDRLEKNSLRRNVITQRINQVSIPVEDSFDSNLPNSKQKPSKRISEYFKEMREFLALSPQCDKGSGKSNILNKVSERLLDYDDGVNSLVTIWEDEQERSEAALAEVPEMRQRYEFFERLIPQIFFKPISFDARVPH